MNEVNQILSTSAYLAILFGLPLAIFLVVVGRAGVAADSRRADGYADGAANVAPTMNEQFYLEGYFSGMRAAGPDEL